MKWHAQVVHVARKDLRRTGWFMLAYSAVVIGATSAVLEWRVSPYTSPWAASLVLLGMLLCAFLVQADSPARSNAFWVSRPLSPTAIFAAKVLVAALLLLGVPLAGQFLGLLAHAVAGRDIPGLLAESALSYGGWLGLAAVVAALTRDLRTFVVALVLLVLGLFVGTLAISRYLNESTTPATPAPLLVTTAVLCGMLLILGHQYVTRDVRRGVLLAGILAVVSLLFLLGIRPLPVAANTPGDLRPVAMRIDQVRLPRTVTGEVQARLRLALGESARSHRYRLASPAAVLHRSDGRREAIAVDQPYVSLRTPDLPLTGGFRWLDGQDPASDLAEVKIDIAPSQKEALSGGDARFTLHGRIEVYEPRVVAALPLEEGAATSRDGYRARIVGVTRKPGGLSVEVRVSSVTSARTAEPRGATDLFAWNSDSYALVNSARREAVALNRVMSSTTDLGLVLPGPRSEVTTMQLEPIPGSRATDLGEIDEQWLQGARLLLVRWAPVGSYPVTLGTDGRPVTGSPECPSAEARCPRANE